MRVWWCRASNLISLGLKKASGFYFKRLLGDMAVRKKVDAIFGGTMRF